MSRYLARRHRHLMDESEHALQMACESPSEQNSRISRHILNDDKVHSHWESQHAKILVPVAEHRRTSKQIVELRLMATRLVHGQAFVEYIRNHEIRGKQRERFLSRYYGPMDYRNAILSAHRCYVLSASSMVSANHLIDVMYDPVSHRLLRQYGDVYRQYFELSSFSTNSDDEICAKALTPLIESARQQLRTIRHKLVTISPHKRCSEFEKQACLARSRRCPALNYLNR